MAVTSTSTSRRSRLWLYVFLTFVLLACLWAGWRDVNLWVSQDAIRENVRTGVRWMIQLLVQYAIPGAITVFFGNEALAALRGKDVPPANDA